MEVPVLQLVLAGIGLILATGTYLSLSDHPHWAVRIWDFPRLHFLFGLCAAIGLYIGFYFGGYWFDWAFVVVTGAAALWHALCVFPYTRAAPCRVEISQAGLESPRSFSLVVSNVLLENEDYARWRKVVLACDPDLILALEVDQRWARELQPLHASYPYRVVKPQDNYYGMALYSRLKLNAPEVRYLLHNDVPSLHTTIELESGDPFQLYGLHPQPPEPIRGQSAAPRDAHLTKIALEIKERGDVPTVVTGDLNDVAWSKTTRLFIRISKLLDPRWGRGTFNSFHARYWFLRFPLDHIFHSDHFTLIDLQRLEAVGSDHFPIYVALHYAPESEAEQPEPKSLSDDLQEAQERLDAQKAERANRG